VPIPVCLPQWVNYTMRILPQSGFHGQPRG
jgi:hypothetical protein